MSEVRSLVLLALVAAAGTGAFLAAEPLHVSATAAAGDRGSRAMSRPLYASTSPFNRPIPSGARLDPGSDVMVRQLVSEVQAKGWAIATREYSVPIFAAGKKTPRTSVRIRNNGKKVALRVPIPRSAFPAEGSDAHMVVLDRATRCEYDFYRASKRPDGIWEADWMNALRTTGTGVFPIGFGARASGFAVAAGALTPRHFKEGRIDHALVFTLNSTKAGGPVPPATSSDGRSTAPGAIPEGARLQLDPTLDLDSMPLAPWQKVIARALQRYGMYLADTGGAVALFAQHPRSAGGYRYPWGEADYGYLPSWLATHLGVLELGPQRPSLHRLVRTSCLTLR